MFINVSNDLPKTAYIKMINIWLLFNLFKPFTDIIMQTYIETYRKESEGREINHHGTKLAVGGNADIDMPAVTKVAPLSNDKM